MSLRDTRKKIQRTIVFLANEYPAQVVLPELEKIRDTVSGIMATMQLELPPADDVAIGTNRKAVLLAIAEQCDKWRPDYAAWLRRQAAIPQKEPIDNGNR